MSASLRLLACAPVLAVLSLPLLASSQESGEPVRGDLGPRVTGLEQLLQEDLTDAQARALFDRLHALLLDRVGSDVISDADLYLGAMQGMLEAVNRRHDESEGLLQRAMPDRSMLLPAEQAAQLRRDLRGEMTGFGIDFRLFPDMGVLLVMDVLPGSPGERAGMRPGDRILSVDRVGFVGAGTQQVLSMLQGEAGSSLTFQVLRGDGAQATAFEIAIDRAVFPLHSTRAELTADNIGWIHLSQLHDGTPNEVEEAVQRLRKLGADELVLDLRHCQGGALQAAVDVADLFLPDKAVVVRVVEPGVGERDLAARRDQLVKEPLAVLVNRWTQGAAEALALALQEHARAYLIGEPTMGSARVETLVPLGRGFEARLLTVRLESPTGTSWQGRGIVPDQSVGIAQGSITIQVGEPPTSQDHQFQSAVHYLHLEQDE